MEIPSLLMVPHGGAHSHTPTHPHTHSQLLQVAAAEQLAEGGAGELVHLAAVLRHLVLHEERVQARRLLRRLDLEREVFLGQRSLATGYAVLVLHFLVTGRVVMVDGGGW